MLCSRIREGTGTLNPIKLLSAAIAGLAVLTLAPEPSRADMPYRPLHIGGKQVRWIPQHPSETVTLRYAVASREMAFRGAPNCGRIRPPVGLLNSSGIPMAAFRQALARAAARWEKVAGIDFMEVEAGGEAEIVFGEQVDPTGFAFTSLALGEARADGTRPIAAAAVCLNPERRWKIGFDGNLAVYDLEHTLAHEIGHAIGLDHPGSRGHLMSFRYTEAIEKLTAGDALGAAAIYGPPRVDARRRGDSVLAITTTESESTIVRGMLGAGRD
jgi:hypothetical protein